MHEKKAESYTEGEPSKVISLVAVGDIGLSARIDQAFPISDLFDMVRKDISSSEVSMGNLECVLGDKGSPRQTYRNLRARSDWAKRLKLFTILSLANNHIMDFGIDGMIETLDLLRREGIPAIGVGENYKEALHPVVLRVDSLRIGFISFTFDDNLLLRDLVVVRSLDKAGPARYHEQYVLKAVRELKKGADLVVASIHWGKEGIHFPSPKQRALAHKLVANGVDLILGHHPHEAQGVEKISKSLVFYSLGNFVFDPRLSKAKFGLMAKIRVDQKGILGYSLFPIGMNRNLRPEKLDDESAFKEIEGWCESLALSDKTYENWWFEQTSQAYLNSYKSNVGIIKKYGIRYIPDFFLGLVLPLSIRYYAGFIRLKIRELVRSPHYW